MNWNETSAIVGFYPAFKIDHAAAALASLAGFRGVKYAYRFAHAVLVELAPGSLDSFISQALRLDYVEYCERNYLVVPAGFQDVLKPWSRAHQANTPVLLHQLTPDRSAGIGVSVALIDSGIAAHPALPLATLVEGIQFKDAWPPHLVNNPNAFSHLQGLESAEQSASPPLLKSVSDQDSFLKLAEQHLARFGDALWQEWERDVHRWHRALTAYNSTRGAAQFFSGSALPSQGSSSGASGAGSPPAGPPSPPTLPLHLHVLGIVRRLSLQSYNFVDDDLNVNDNVGHGTQMAGILAGRAGGTLGVRDPGERQYVEKCEVSIQGIVPDAELIVLKCYDRQNIQNGNVHALIRALERSAAAGADVVYVGLALDSTSGAITPRNVITLLRTIAALHSRDIPVVCPAGNRSSHQLDLPAALNEGLAVTALHRPRGQSVNLALAPYSNRADQGESVAFCAFGGDDQEGVLTTSLNYGFAVAQGTSVAAAISAGLIAKSLSNRYLNHVQNEYQSALRIVTGNPRAGNVTNVRNVLTPSRLPLADLLGRARAAAYFEARWGQAPSQEHGWGAIREFL